MAEDEARDLDAKRIVRCRKCGDERQEGWDIKQGFQAMYAYAGVIGNFNRHRSLRSRVQHGNTIFSTSSPSEFLPEVRCLQLAAIAAVSKRIRLLPQSGEYLMTSIPVTVFGCVFQDNNYYTVNGRSFNVGAVSSFLPMRRSANAGRTFRMGMDDPPKIDPLVLPPVQR
jgi:hypothetical protein